MKCVSGLFLTAMDEVREEDDVVDEGKVGPEND